MEHPAQTQPSAEELARQLLAEPRAAKRAALCRAAGSLAVVEALKAQVDHFKDVDSAQALLAGERAHEASALVDDPMALPLGLWALALGLTVQGRFEEALPRFERARAAYGRLGAEVEVARVAMREVQALAMTGAYDKAIELSRRAHDTFADHGLWRDAGSIDNNLGIIYTRLGQFDQAEATLRRALEGLSTAGDRLGVARAHVNLGRICQEQDRFREAGLHLQRALTTFQEQEQTQSVAGTMVDLALLYRREGRLGKALELLTRVRGIYERLEAGPDSALAQLEEARIHLELSLLEEAETITRELVEVFGARDMHLERLEALMVQGLAQARGGRMGEAQATLELARSGWQEFDNAGQAALTSLYIAGLQLGAGQDPAGALELARAAIPALAAKGLRSGQLLGLLTAAEAQLALGRADEASASLDEAERLAGALGVPELMLRCSHLQGRANERRGQVDQAEARYKEAIDHLEGVRASLPVDEFKASYVGDKLAVYGELIALLLAQGRAREALEYAERARSRALLDMLAKGVEARRADGDPELEALSRRLQEAREELNWNFLSAEAEGPQGPHWDKVVEGEREVTMLLRELERLRPDAAALERVTVPPLDEVLAQLADDTLLVEYVGLGDTLAAFVVSGEGVRAVAELAPLAEVKAQLERLSFFLTRVALEDTYAHIYGPELLRKSVDTHLKALFELLIAPLELDGRYRKLVIVPYGPLHAVPFAAMFDGSSYLLERAEVSLAPSAAVYLLCARRDVDAAGPLKAFGVPTDDIPEVRAEVEAVAAAFEGARTFLGKAASKEAFFRHAPQASLLHFATHGVNRPDNPMFSGLRLGDGWLVARDLYGLQLSASLVVLSACESGLTSQGGGDELFGLARGFLYAGVPSLVASLWPVKDAQTTLLMTQFYRHLRGGARVGAALREAQLEVRKAHPNPYHWAAFSVVGDPERRPAASDSSGSRAPCLE